MKLNPEQQQAADHFQGVCIVTATPGSGKTSTLTERVVNLIEKKNIPPSNLLCLTFTNKAANEMRERVSSRIGTQSSQVWISTFHALCLAILRKYGTHVGLDPNFTIYSEKDQKDLLHKIATVHEIDSSKENVAMMAKVVNDFREDIEDFEHAISRVGSGERSVIREYIQSLDEFNSIDFSGLLYKTWILLSKVPKASKILSDRFQYVLVDEMQDTNSIQYEIIRMIVDPSRTRQGNLFAVGDLCQSIFGWRGARPENIQKIENDFDNVARITLPRNYRSTANILRSAQNLIRHNKNAQDVCLIAERGEGANVVYAEHYDPDEEAKQIVNVLQGLKAKYKYSYSDFVVLYRTNALSKAPEAILRKYGIPYRIVGGFSFFDRSEIKTAISYLSFLANPNDPVSFVRAITCPKRKIGGTVLSRIESIAKENHISLLDACGRHEDIKGLTSASKTSLSNFAKTIKEHADQCKSNKPLSEIFASLLEKSGYYDYVDQLSKKDDKSSMRIDNVNELLAGMDTKYTGSTMKQYLDDVRLKSDLDTIDEDDAVSLMTMHSAKGLEFPVVFIIGAESDIIPHVRAIEESRISEERRLMYVAMTRAQDCLIINRCLYRRKYSRSKKKIMPMPSIASPFLAESKYDKEYEKATEED